MLSFNIILNRSKGQLQNIDLFAFPWSLHIVSFSTTNWNWRKFILTYYTDRSGSIDFNAKKGFLSFRKPSPSPLYDYNNVTAQKMKFSIKDFLSKCDQISSFLRILSQLMKKSLVENFIFYAVHFLAMTCRETC